MRRRTPCRLSQNSPPPPPPGPSQMHTCKQLTGAGAGTRVSECRKHLKSSFFVFSLKIHINRSFRVFFLSQGSSSIILGFKNPSLGTSSLYIRSVSKFLILRTGPAKEERCHGSFSQLGRILFTFPAPAQGWHREGAR